jgi:hypothetical protein
MYIYFRVNIIVILVYEVGFYHLKKLTQNILYFKTCNYKIFPGWGVSRGYAAIGGARGQPAGHGAT